MDSPSPSCRATLQCVSGPERAQVWGQQVLVEGRGGQGRCRSQAGTPPRRVSLCFMVGMSVDLHTRQCRVGGCLRYESASMGM